MEENFLADKPINEEGEDKFQRYGFSKRIAQTILNRKSSDSIVIGLYGAWGEGKTSVLNFIRQELQSHSTEVVHLTFNPWRFTDEAALLTSFFYTLGNELKKNLVYGLQPEPVAKTNWWSKRKGALKTNTETIGELFQEYGKVVSVFGAGETATTIGKIISNVDVEKLKERIETLLIQNKKRVVIFIDDIDRLEKTEIHAIFRLVKLTGDFTYTTYVLSFDENMVASAIGERFGEGDKNAGLSFLEKIIQIPLKLPLAQKTALQNHCFQLIEQALNAAQITLTEAEGQEFAIKFSTNFLVRLTTPRLGVRYGNALSFSLPLLKGEVNYVDLLLIEGIRVFYPELYELVRTEPDYFIGGYGKEVYADKNEKVTRFKLLFQEATSSYSPNEILNAQDALRELFPNLSIVWGTTYRGTMPPQRQYAEKRISTTQYFNRYFSYTVLTGDVSDVAINSLLENIAGMSSDEAKESMKLLIKSSLPANFIEKLRFREKTFNSNTSIAIVKAIGLLGDLFPNNYDDFFYFMGAFPQLAIFIGRLIKNQMEQSSKLEITEWLVKNANPFELSCEILRVCLNKDEATPKLFNEEQDKILVNELIERAKNLAVEIPIWEKFMLEAPFILNSWSKNGDKNELADYVKKQLAQKPNAVGSLLKVFVSFIKSSAYPKRYYGDFNQKSYDWLKDMIGVDIIFECLNGMLSQSELEVDTYQDLEYLQTEENIIKQFLYWYRKEKSEAK